jgi:hypothetical protein
MSNILLLLFCLQPIKGERDRYASFNQAAAGQCQTLEKMSTIIFFCPFAQQKFHQLKKIVGVQSRTECRAWNVRPQRMGATNLPRPPPIPPSSQPTQPHPQKNLTPLPNLLIPLSPTPPNPTPTSLRSKDPYWPTINWLI